MEKVKLEKTKIHQKYLLADGREVVGVTTALNVISKPQLIQWAWNEGKAGRDFRKVRDAAADVGTLCHFMCECHLKGIEPDMSEFSSADVKKAENGFIKFVSWWDKNKFKLVASEKQCVSEKNCYGGTIDIIAEDETGMACLIDLKTSSGIYDSMFWQVAAYRQLWDEIDSRKIIKVYIVRIGKDEKCEDFEVREKVDSTHDFMIFLDALKLYNDIKKAKKSY